uniref:Uncharacterized protein n=1 Tax=Arundo donax TaxID=35708 RepID=A0A0A8YDM9_ARUDO
MLVSLSASPGTIWTYVETFLGKAFILMCS